MGQGRQRGRGTQPCPCMGRHSTGVAQGNPAVLNLVHNLLSVGTLEQPDLGHLVDDFQRTEKDKLWANCVLLSIIGTHVLFYFFYINIIATIALQINAFVWLMLIV